MANQQIPPGVIVRPAGAQLFLRGAHNSNTNEYLLVWAEQGSTNPENGKIRGLRVTANGNIIVTDPPFLVIDGAADGNKGNTPDIAFNPNANAADPEAKVYLVVWDEDAGPDTPITP
jgi:hypothetical protein